MSEPRLLVTFALFTYNQEAYVAEAVEGALSQDYSPLEIIISDDASTDRTFEIIQGLVRDYRGPHEVRLIRNEANLGIGAHVTKVANLARSELIVAAAGDDVSLPGRTRAMTALWEAHDRKPDLLCCDAALIGLRNEPLGECQVIPGIGLDALEFVRTGQVVLGALTTWTRRLWQAHPSLPDGCVSEDQVLGLRGAMLGGIARHPEALVRYRIGCGISDSPDPTDLEPFLRHRQWWCGQMLSSLRFQIEDAHRAGRTDITGHLLARRRAMELVDALYRRERWPSPQEWRSAADPRFAKLVAVAIAQTRLPRTYLRWRRGRAWIRRLTNPVTSPDRR